MIHTETVELLRPIESEGKRYQPGIHTLPLWLTSYLLRERLAIYPGKTYAPKAAKH